MHVHAPIDHLVFSSAWRRRSPVGKLVFAGGLLLYASVLPVLPWSLVVFAIAVSAALAGARIPLRSWLRFLAPQAGFLAAACLPLLITLSPPGWSAGGVETAVTVFLRGLAAAASLTLLSLTTPIPDLLLVARTARVPAALVELAFLVYRLMSSSFELLGRLRLGLDLRLSGTPLSLPAASLSAGNLLVRSLRTARRVERGAALRGLDGYPLLPPRFDASDGLLASALALHATLAVAAIVLAGGGRLPW